MFGFDVVEAAKEMSSLLYKLDNLYTISGNELNELICHLHPYVVNEVNRILHISLNTTRRVMQPAVDVSLQLQHNDAYIS